MTVPRQPVPPRGWCREETFERCRPILPRRDDSSQAIRVARAHWRWLVAGGGAGGWLHRPRLRLVPRIDRRAHPPRPRARRLRQRRSRADPGWPPATRLDLSDRLSCCAGRAFPTSPRSHPQLAAPRRPSHASEGVGGASRIGSRSERSASSTAGSAATSPSTPTLSREAAAVAACPADNAAARTASISSRCQSVPRAETARARTSRRPSRSSPRPAGYRVRPGRAPPRPAGGPRCSHRRARAWSAWRVQDDR